MGCGRLISKTTFPQHILRAYDIRGLYPQEINENLFYRFGQAFGTLVVANQGQRVCVGRDGRLSSPGLTKALIQGLISTGMTVYDIGCGPSPLLYYAEKMLQPDGALMVTGSHNSRDFNGLKMILQQQPFFGKQILAFGQAVMAAQFHNGQGQVVEHDLNDSYIKRLTDEFRQYYSSGRPLKIVWDPGHGAAAAITKTLVQHLPGDHIVINDVIDGAFPAHHPDPTIETNLQQLRQVVLDQRCDVGIAFDGDGDRIGIMDDQGHFIRGDQFLLLYAEEVLRNSPGATILADVKASQTVFDRIKEWDGQALMVATGHSNIKYKMRETDALLAGEMSGHVFFADRYYGYDDALYAALRTMGIVSMSDKSLSAWRQDLPVVFNTPEIKIPCTSQDKTWIIKHLRDALQHDDLTFDSTDGVRVNFPGGWWLLRASNTEEVLVGRVEGSSPEHRDTGHQQLMRYLQQAQMMVETDRQ